MIYRNAVSFAGQRLWAQRWLALSQMIGLLAAVTLAVAIPLYADGVNHSILNASLTASTARTSRPPFDFVFRYIGSWYGDLAAEEYRPVDAYLSQQTAAEIGLPLVALTRYGATANLPLYPAAETLSLRQRLDLVRLAFLSGVFDHIQLVEGSLPRSTADNDGPVEALVSLELANDLGLHAGQAYTLYNPSPAYRQEVILSGVWTPRDPAEDFWALYPADSFQKKLLVREDAWWAAVAALPTPLDEAAWRLSLAGGQVNSAGVPGLLARIDRAQNRANALLPHTDLESSPTSALRQYRQAAQSLTGSLFAFSAPVLGLALFFLALVAGLFVRSQRNEIAVLRSRGAPRAWILAVYFFEWALLGLAALLLGLPGGLGLANVIGRTRSFLDFSNPPAFAAHLSGESVAIGLAAVLLGIGFCLLPVWQSGRDTIVSYKQERARARRAPRWQRLYLDFVCLLPAFYGLYTLRAEGRLALLGRAIGSTDPYQNPLLFLLPALLIVGLSLLALRSLPPLLNILARLAGRLPGVLPVFVLRQFARSGNTYQAAMLLIALTLGLAAFSSSMAHSLDAGLSDGILYRVGADLNLVEGGEFVRDAPAGGAQTDASSAGGLWNFIPISDHLALPGVQAAARVGRYDASLSAGGRTARGLLMGIDRGDFPGVAFFRPDFAAEPLNALMNRMAAAPGALLVDRLTWERFNLTTGDTLELRVAGGAETSTLRFSVAGVFERFPGWVPDEGEALFVANLDYLFETWGSLQPYDVWLRTTPGADTQLILDGVRQMGVAVVRAQDSRAEIQQALDAPGRQGVLGMLSVGFLASAGLTVLGFSLYALFSFRERFIQWGVLRAIGLSARQMRAGLAAELACLTLAGILTGTLAGVATARGFVPSLPVNAGSGTDVLPHVSEIAWGELAQVYALFGATLLAGITALAITLRRMKIFQAIKLGETL